MKMDERELLANWGEQKRSHNYHRLDAHCEVDFEFIGYVGHPSSYAYVKFSCAPASETSLEFSVEWPKDFDAVYTLRIQHAIAEAILDTLFSRHVNSVVYRGCELRLTDFRWDDVGGSEAAVYRATTKAMIRLCERGRWAEVDSRYRQYPAT